MSTKVVIVGFGNVGRAVYDLIRHYRDLELAGIVTRDVDRVKSADVSCDVFHMDDIPSWWVRAEVAILCGGSKSDLPQHGPMFARSICTVDSYDTHAHIGPYKDEATGEMMLGYKAQMDVAARAGGFLSHICVGWDPGTFSIMRAYFNSCLPGSKAYAFYGLTRLGGLSMGHSDAIRRVEGVADARSYTHARPEAIAAVRAGNCPDFQPGEMHWRENFIVLKTEADRAKVEKEVANMPAYFAGYETTFKYIDQSTMDGDHQEKIHDGLVLAVGPSGMMEFRNEWKSNPMGTAGMLLAYARATAACWKAGQTGAYTVLDTPLNRLLPAEIDPISLI